MLEDAFLVQGQTNVNAAHRHHHHHHAGKPQGARSRLKSAVGVDLQRHDGCVKSLVSAD